MQVIDRNVRETIEVIARRGRRRKQLLDDLKEKRGHRKMKKEAQDCTLRGPCLEEAIDM
jgi:hypothetical protein